MINIANSSPSGPIIQKLADKQTWIW